MSRFILALFVLLLSARARADAGDETMTIADVVTRATSAHPALSALEAESQARLALREQAAVRPTPEAEFGAGLRDTDTDSGYALEASVLFPVERDGKRETRMAIAQSDTLLAKAALAQARRDLELRIRTLGYEYLAASADAAIAGEIAERSRAMIALLTQRPAAGPVILLELRVIEGSLVEFQKSARDFEAQRDTARIALNVLLRRDPDAPLHLRDDLRVPVARFDLATLAANLERTPSLLQRLEETKRARLSVEAAEREIRPDFRIGPYFSWEETDEAETTLGLAASIPLSGSRQQRGAIAAARARLEGAQAQWAAAVQDARLELARLHRIYESAVEQANAIPPDLVASLHDAADLADRQYRLGAIPVQLFLDMQREFLSVQLLRHNALLEALKKEVELKWLTDAALGEDAP